MKANVLGNVTKALAGIALGGKKGDPHLAAIDRGVLEVSMMLAALDGEILPQEYAAFEQLARKCRGATAKNVRECLDGAIRKGGYLMAMAQIGVYGEKDRLDAFVKLAADSLPKGFESGSMADLRRAFALWVAMGVSDGAFSDIERKAVKALADNLASIRVKGKAKRIALLEDGFLEKAEKIVRDMSVAAKRAKAEAALDKLVGTVEVKTSNGKVEKPSAKIGVRIAVMALLTVAAAPLFAAGNAGAEDMNAPDGMIHRRAFRDAGACVVDGKMGEATDGQWSVGFNEATTGQWSVGFTF